MDYFVALARVKNACATWEYQDLNKPFPNWWLAGGVVRNTVGAIALWR
jgi:hypothetical protein